MTNFEYYVKTATIYDKSVTLELKDGWYESYMHSPDSLKLWLQEDYKEKLIKLTRFEYDLLRYFSATDSQYEQFSYFNCLMVLKAQGHYKNVKDYYNLDFILYHCEVID